MSFPEGGSGSACLGLAQRHPEKIHLLHHPLGMNVGVPWVSTEGVEWWLEVRSARASWALRASALEIHGTRTDWRECLSHPLVLMEQTGQRRERFAPGLGRKSKPIISFRSSLY